MATPVEHEECRHGPLTRPATVGLVGSLLTGEDPDSRHANAGASGSTQTREKTSEDCGIAQTWCPMIERHPRVRRKSPGLDWAIGLRGSRCTKGMAAAILVLGFAVRIRGPEAVRCINCRATRSLVVEFWPGLDQNRACDDSDG